MQEGSHKYAKSCYRLNISLAYHPHGRFRASSSNHIEKQWGSGQFAELGTCELKNADSACIEDLNYKRISSYVFESRA